MEDIKLTIEEIKKGCEFADEYTILGDGTLQFSNGDYFRKYVLYSGEWEYNKLGDFLQRVIEGISEHSDFFIEQTSKTIDVTWYMHPTKPGHKERFICSSIDQAKTQAIKYILDKLK